MATQWLAEDHQLISGLPKAFPSLHFRCKCWLSCCSSPVNSLRAEIAQSVWLLATGWKVWGSNPCGGEIFRTPPGRPWDPPSLLRNWYRVTFSGVKRPGRGVDTHLAPRLKKEYSYTSASPLGLRGLFYGELYLYIYLNLLIRYVFLDIPPSLLS